MNRCLDKEWHEFCLLQSVQELLPGFSKFIACSNTLSVHAMQQHMWLGWLLCLQVMCHHLSTRKSGLVQAARRLKQSDITAFIFLPGGLGTMDELFELLTLMQLRKLPSQQMPSAAAASGASPGSKSLMAPVLLVDYDGFYQGFVTFLKVR